MLAIALPINCTRGGNDQRSRCPAILVLERLVYAIALPDTAVGRDSLL